MATSLVSGNEFAQLREVLKSKQNKLTRKGKGNLPNKPDPLTGDDTR
jgi:hypothetical protein